MIRTFFAANLFVGTLFVIAMSGATGQQPPKGKFDPPASMKPDEATLKLIAEKTELLRKAVAELKEKKLRDDVVIEVEIYLKAAEYIDLFEEWFHKDSGNWALTTLDRGLERAKQAGGGEAVWRDAPGKWVLRAYRSNVDGSIQPYAVLLPQEYGKDPKKKWRLDVVLHGRDSSLTEAKFIATHTGTAPKNLDYVQLEPYGRGNNAYRWAGETDVLDAAGDFGLATVDRTRTVLRGFSMGGAGTWHLGLHSPDLFCAIGPGAGFTTTHGYIANLPAQLPDYQEKCLRIYDADGYAENAYNVPIVAYSGEKDPQKAAADNIEKLLKSFKEPLRFTHLVAPGLEHKMPAEWQTRAEVEFRKYAEQGRKQQPDRVRFVTFTPQYGICDWLTVHALDATYAKAVVDATRTGDQFKITTTNVRRLILQRIDEKKVPRVTIDGQTLELGRLIAEEDFPGLILEKENGNWGYIRKLEGLDRIIKRPIKDGYCTGPIDDAFRGAFRVVRPTGEGWHPAPTQLADSLRAEFAYTWIRYFRGRLPAIAANQYKPNTAVNLVLFGDPESNSLIADFLPKLPITWTKEKLIVNGVEYDPKTHLPVLIYPNPYAMNGRYVVLNSGHTFKEADLKGTNALLYPRLGDWAVIKPTPTAKDPAAYEVVAAGLFDENWQFPKKKP